MPCTFISFLAHFISFHKVNKSIPAELITNVVPHEQFAMDIVPIGLSGTAGMIVSRKYLTKGL